MMRWILLAAVTSWTGPWHGGASVMGIDLEFEIHIAGRPDSLTGTVDIPAQGVSRMQLKDVRARGDSVSFVFPVPGAPATFAGVVRGDSITGKFRQAGITAPFHLARGAAPTAAADSTVSYVMEEVRVPSGNATLAGTLSHPRGAGPWPALVTVSGSGASNRDENVLGFKPFAVLADHLTRNGIAVLRCDDRGVGGSTGKFSGATSRDFADDLRASIRFLASRKDIDRHRIGALGHSEGGIIAPMVAAGSDSVAFLVLLGAPGVRGDSVLLDQTERITRAIGMEDTLRVLENEAQKRIVHSVTTGRNWEEARVASVAALRRAMRGVADDSTIVAAADAQIQAMKGPWMNFFLTYDPLPALRKVRCPVLAVFGANDLQVAPELNAPPLEHALRSGGNRDVTIRVLPRANHLFQEADSGSPMLYATLKKEFIPGFLDTVSAWVATRTTPGAKKATAAKR